MNDKTPSIERTIKFSTTVDELPAAWAFVMEKIDEVGPDPQIEIKPLWQADADAPLNEADTWKRVFEVAVSGMVEVTP